MTLTIQDLGALGELLGSIAVLATLVYLTLQTRQNRLAIAAQLDASMMRARQEGPLSVATSTELGEAVYQQRIEAQPIEQVRVQLYWLTQVTRWQWEWQHGRRGLLLSYREDGMGRVIAGQFDRYRDYGEWWDRQKSVNWNPEFVEWVEEQRSQAA